MSKIIDLSAKLSNECPVVKLMEGFVVTVNNRKSNILTLQTAIKEKVKKVQDAESKGKEVDVEKEKANLNMITLQFLIGKPDAERIEKLDLPLPEFAYLVDTLFSVAKGEVESEEDRFQQK